MRYLVRSTLSNGYKVYVLVEGVSNQNDAKMSAITNSALLPEQYHIKKTDNCSIEKWNTNQNNQMQGNAKYSYYVVKNRQLITSGNVNAAGAKTALNNLIPNMVNTKVYLIYLVDSRREAEVNSRKRSATAEAQAMMTDTERRRRSLGRAIEKSKAAGNSRLIQEVGLLCSCVEDYCTGKYRTIPVGTIIGILACILYFVSPIDLIPDFLHAVVPGVAAIDDIAVVGFAIKAAHDDLLQYEEWRKNNNVE